MYMWNFILSPMCALRYTHHSDHRGPRPHLWSIELNFIAQFDRETMKVLGSCIVLEVSKNNDPLETLMI